MTVRCPKCQTDNPSDSKYCKECATPLPTAKTPRPEVTETLQTPIKELTTGSTFAGRYQIIEELGKGGMGKVYKVFDTRIKEKVALKLIKPEVASDRETIERFNNELRLSRKVRHKNVCGMFDIGEAEGSYFITMEYVHGEDLKSMIRMSTGLTVGTVLSVGKQVCDGLAEAHSLGVVHRDLKPQNIMIDKGGNAKIMDFGIARSIREKGITGPSVLIGTPEYMSPEQAEPKEVDQRSDIYSLGIILYEMATGRVPFKGDTALSIAMKHKGEIPKNPKQFNPNIPDDLSGAILKCLEKDKAARYQTAEDVRSELDKIEKGIPTAERVVPDKKALTSREITVKFSLRKLFVPALIFIALIIIGAILWRIVPSRKAVPSPSAKPSLAILYFDNVSGDKSLDAWKTGLTELLITKLSQSKFINVIDGTTVYSILKKFNLDGAKRYTKGDLQKVAEEGGATHTLSGTLMKAGQNIIMTLSLQKPLTGEVISSIPVECHGEQEIMSKVDEVAAKIKSDLDLSPQQIAGDIDKELEKITTASPEAYKYYSEARKFHLAQDYRPAMQLYEKAVTIDPGFAMAYRGMAALYDNLGDVEKMREAIKKALSLSDRTSERERLIIQAQYYYSLSEKTFDKAIEAFQKLLEIYLDDSHGNNFLGEIYHELEEPEKGIEYHMAAYKNSKTILHIWNVYHDYQHLGQYEEAQKIFEVNLPTISDDPSVPTYLGANYLYQGKYELALGEADKAFLKSPDLSRTHYLKGRIYLLQDNFAAAEKEFRTVGVRIWLSAVYRAQGRFEKEREEVRQMIASADSLGSKLGQANSELRLGYIDLRTGHLGKGLEEIEKASIIYEELDMAQSQRVALSLKGILYAEQGDLEKARQTAEELKGSIKESPNRKAIRYYDLLAGSIALKKGNVWEAVENFKKAISLLPFQCHATDEHAFFMEPLARAYDKSGDLEKAKKEYEKITLLTSGRLFYGDTYARSFYWLGKIYERQGDKVKAREHYQKFLFLWKDADPGLPEVEDARKRLAELRGT